MAGVAVSPRETTCPMRCENAPRTFRRADGLKNQYGLESPTPTPYAMSNKLTIGGRLVVATRVRMAMGTLIQSRAFWNPLPALSLNTGRGSEGAVRRSRRQ